MRTLGIAMVVGSVLLGAGGVAVHQLGDGAANGQSVAQSEPAGAYDIDPLDQGVCSIAATGPPTALNLNALAPAPGVVALSGTGLNYGSVRPAQPPGGSALPAVPANPGY